MTEKHYGGSSSFGFKGGAQNANSNSVSVEKQKANSKSSLPSKSESLDLIDKFIKAGKITAEVKKYAKTIVKKGVSLIELAEKLESKIIELGGKPAFPVNLSINEIAAHYTPSFDDKTLAHGLIKVDFGVHIDGCAADTSISFDLEDLELNKKLIKSAESALDAALKVAKEGTKVSEIGKVIEDSIKKDKFQPVQNLSGHSIEVYDLHAGLTIPNIDNNSTVELTRGVYAIEPFVTTGLGAVKDSKPSTIYHLQSEGNVRDNFSREVLAFIAEEYQTLPFCSRWIHKKFGSRGLLALRRLEDAKILYQYPMLVEKGNGIVAQAEHTILISDNKVVVTTNG